MLASRAEERVFTAPAAAAGFEVEVLYDGAWPLCVREIHMLQDLDRRQQDPE